MRSGAAVEREDAIHALTSSGGTLAASNLPAPHAIPHARDGRFLAEPQDDRSPFAVTAPAAREDLSHQAPESQRSRDVTRPAAPATDIRPTPAVTADRVPAPAPQAGHAQAAPASATPGLFAPSPATPLAAQPLYDLAGADQSLQATALGKNAHLHLDAGAAGPVSLHLTVQDGVADVEVEGPGAERLELRPEELRRALAGEGLSLGHFATRVTETAESRTQQDPPRDQGGQSQGNGDRASQSDQAARQAATPFAAQSGASSYGGEGRRHWQGETPESAERDGRPGGAPPNGAPSSSGGDTPPSRRRGVHVTA